MAHQFTDSNFENDALNSNQLVVVDFWAEWCGPCRIIAPIVEELAVEFEGRALIGKVDVDTNSEVSTNYNIRSIPTLLFLKGGEIVDRHVGGISKAALTQKIEALL
jgi:thioredoxin 1